MIPPFVELVSQLFSTSIAKAMYNKQDLFPFGFYSLANIPDVAVQVVTDAKENREGNFLSFVQFAHCSSRDSDLSL